MPKAYASSVLPAPADAVWAVIRDFNALPDWHPGIETSEIEGGLAGDQVGCVRSFVLTDGTHIRESLRELSDASRSYTYDFVESPFPVENYLATIRCTPVTDRGGCFIEWWTIFDCEVAAREQWIDTFATGVFQPGFDALHDRFTQ